MGDGTTLVRMSKRADAGLALDDDRDRFAALMSVVSGRTVAADAIRHVEAADAHWRRVDKALANLRLILADLPRVATPADACRLTLAAHLLDEGMAPAELMAELGFAVSDDFEKYSREQPRVPEGHGQESGRFGSDGESQTFVPPPVGLAPALAPEAGAAAIAVPIAGLVAFGLAMVIPTPNSRGVDEGKLKDMPDVRYLKDGPAGTLKLTTTAPDGSDVTVHAGNRSGVYVDVRTGQVLGRDLGASIALDRSAVHAAIDAEIAAQDEKGPERKPTAAADEPEVCPAPEPDAPHGSSDRAKDYEDDVHHRVNPENPIPRGYAVRVTDPAGGFIYFDDCFRLHGDLVDGDMKAGDLVEAKGEGFKYLIAEREFTRPMDEFVEKATRQMRAAQARGAGLKWYFAEEKVADLARAKFKSIKELRGIIVSHMPRRKGR